MREGWKEKHCIGGGQRGTLRQFYNFYHFLTFQKPDICDFLLIWRLYILKLYFC